MELKHANKFFKIVKAMDSAMMQSSNDEISFYSTYDCNPDECFKRDDGLWQLNRRVNCHNYGCGHSRGHLAAFLWRIAPKFYNTSGQPCYSFDQEKEFMEKSETEKVLVSHNGFEYIWRWNTFNRPNRNIWGLTKGPSFFELRKDHAFYARSAVKADFLRQVSSL
jgi:hypothetical protein